MAGEASPLRWGILGCGKISRDYVRALKYCTNAHEVAAVATSNSVERAKKFLQDVGLSADKTKAYGSYDELLADKAVDVIYIGVINNGHCEWTMKALVAKKPVLCEKPLGVNATEVRQMAEASRKNKTFLMEAYWSRFFPSWRKMRELINEEKYGKVNFLSVNFGVKIRKEFFDTSKGITPLLDIGGYTLQLATFVFAGKKPARIHAVGKLNDEGCDVWTNITLDYGDGTQASCYVNGVNRCANSAVVCCERGQLQLPEFFWSATRLTEIYGESEFSESSEHKNPSSQDIKRIVHDYPLQDKEERDLFYYAHSSGLRFEADHIYECLRQGKLESDVMSLDESILLHEIITEIRRQLGVVFPQDSA